MSDAAAVTDTVTKLQAERDEAIANYLKVADTLGYVNRAEGQSGYEMADPDTLIRAFKEREEHAETMEWKALCAKEELKLTAQSNQALVFEKDEALTRIKQLEAWQLEAGHAHFDAWRVRAEKAESEVTALKEELDLASRVRVSMMAEADAAKTENRELLKQLHITQAQIEELLRYQTSIKSGEVGARLAIAEAELNEAVVSMAELRHELVRCRNEEAKAERDEAVARAERAERALLVDISGLTTMTWKEMATMISGYNQKHMFERDTARKALESVLPLASRWADGVGRSHPDHDTIAEAETVLLALKKTT